MNQKTLNRYVSLCRRMLDLPDSRCKHFSFILDGNKQVSFGWNLSFKTHPLAAKYGYRFNCIHSEVMAIRNFPYPIYTIKDYKILNIRLDKIGNLRMSKPCNNCQRLLTDLSIGGIIYSIGDGEFSIC